MTNSHSRLLLLMLHLLVITPALFAEDSQKYRQIFRMYLQAVGRLSTEGISPEVSEKWSKHWALIRDDIIANPQKAGETLSQLYRDARNAGNKTEQILMMSFCGFAGFAKDEFLQFARDTVATTNLEAGENLVITAMEYLGKYGDQSDIDLMKRLDIRGYPKNVMVRDYYVSQIEKRISPGKEIGPAEDEEFDSARQTQAKGVVGAEIPLTTVKETGFDFSWKWLVLIALPLPFVFAYFLSQTGKRARGNIDCR